MRIAILGGKLQGLEALYLARKGDFETVLIDKRKNIPARGLCDHFIPFEFAKGKVGPYLPGFRPDLIIPALENSEALEAAQRWASDIGVPFAFDLDAFHLSSSKQRSNSLFSTLQLPLPTPWPKCGYPAIIKPDNASGSKGVVVLHNDSDFKKVRQDLNSKIIQEFLEGPSYSIEIIGEADQYKPLQITELSMDSINDCKRVTAPVSLTHKQIGALEEMVVQIAQTISLKGIMDLEVILHKDTFKILEIDARLPSQTPMAVYWSTGINMVTMLVELFTRKPNFTRQQARQHYSLVEHVQVKGTELLEYGEHIMADKGPLHLRSDFFGADEAITNYSPETSLSNRWVATLIYSAKSKADIITKRNKCHSRIRQQHKINGE